MVERREDKIRMVERREDGVNNRAEERRCEYSSGGKINPKTRAKGESSGRRMIRICERREDDSNTEDNSNNQAERRRVRYSSG